MFARNSFGKVSMLNGDGSLITTGTIVPVKEYAGTNQTIIVLKIKSSEDGVVYDQKLWIDNYNREVRCESIYASDPAAAKAYAESVQKAVDAISPQTPRPAPVRRTTTTVYGMRNPECEWY